MQISRTAIAAAAVCAVAVAAIASVTNAAATAAAVTNAAAMNAVSATFAACLLVDCCVPQLLPLFPPPLPAPPLPLLAVDVIGNGGDCGKGCGRNGGSGGRCVRSFSGRMFKILLIKSNILNIKLGQGEWGSQNGTDRWIDPRL
jgi:hypothetical protein